MGKGDVLNDDEEFVLRGYLEEVCVGVEIRKDQSSSTVGDETHRNV